MELKFKFTSFRKQKKYMAYDHFHRKSRSYTVAKSHQGGTNQNGQIYLNTCTLQI